MTLGTNALKSHLELTLKENGQGMYIKGILSPSCEFLGKGSLFFDKFAVSTNVVSFADFEQKIHTDDLSAYRATVKKAFQAFDEEPVIYHAEYRIEDIAGNYQLISEKGTILKDDESDVVFVHAVLEGKKVEPSRFVVDAVPSDKGRSVMVEEIDYIIEHNNPADPKGYVLTIGVDRLSLVNEAFGAHVTDELLFALSSKLQEVVGHTGQAYHLSGDVYGILFAESSANEMPAMARHILNYFYENLVQVNEHFIRISISIGGRYVGDGITQGSTIVANAERALQVAKESGRGCFISFNSERHGGSTSQSMLKIGDEFLRGLNDGRVRMAFQPIVNSKSGDVSFHECLMRLTDLEGNVHAAGTFIPAVEQLGMSRIVDQFCIRQAIQELSLFPDLVLSVNVTNWTLMDNDWLRGLVYILSDRPDVAQRLIVEITESVAMVDIRQTLRVVHTLRDLGCRVALDDFGAGATAFTQLKDLDLDIVKIDKSFVRHMNDDQNYLFIKTLQSLADGMQLETVGEGAETLDEADILASDGVTYIQGYAYGFPSMDRSWLPKDHENRSRSLHEITGDKAYNFWDS